MLTWEALAGICQCMSCEDFGDPSRLGMTNRRLSVEIAPKPRLRRPMAARLAVVSSISSALMSHSSSGSDSSAAMAGGSLGGSMARPSRATLHRQSTHLNHAVGMHKMEQRIML